MSTSTKRKLLEELNASTKRTKQNLSKIDRTNKNQLDENVKEESLKDKNLNKVTSKRKTKVCKIRKKVGKNNNAKPDKNVDHVDQNKLVQLTGITYKPIIQTCRMKQKEQIGEMQSDLDLELEKETQYFSELDNLTFREIS